MAAPTASFCYDLDTNRTIGVYPSPPQEPGELQMDMDRASWTLIQEAVLAGRRIEIRECPLRYADALKMFQSGDELVLVRRATNSNGRRDTRPVNGEVRERAIKLLDAGNSIRKVASMTGLSKSAVQRLKSRP